MSVFKKAGVVVTSPSSGTYVVEEIGNVGVLADLLDECLAAGGHVCQLASFATCISLVVRSLDIYYYY